MHARHLTHFDKELMLELADYIDDTEEEATVDVILTSTSSLALGLPDQLSDDEHYKQLYLGGLAWFPGGRISSGPSIYVTSKRPLQSLSGIDFSSMNDRPTKKPKPDMPRTSKRKISPPCRSTVKRARSAVPERPKTVTGSRTLYAAKGLGRLGFSNPTFRR